MRGRLLVVSHASVLPVNQQVYGRLASLGWEPTVVVPERWRHDFSAEPIEPRAATGLCALLRPLPVALAGRPQRHAYLVRASAIVRNLRPLVAFVEEEAFSLAALQWGGALARVGVPFGIQCAHNRRDRQPVPARAIRRFVLRRAAFVAARSVTAAQLARRWGAGRAELVPHAVPDWPRPARAHANGTFTVGFAGRLVEEKGLRDLVEAAGRLGSRVELVAVGDGPLRGELESAGVRVVTGVKHERMNEELARMDVLVLPSRTTPPWSEQFGRVLVEALWCGVPVVGSDSGEIPWVIRQTGGGLVFPEGDVAALADALARLRESPALREQLASAGRAAVEESFSVDAAAAALDGLLLDAVAGRDDA